MIRTIRGKFTNATNGRLARHLLRYEDALTVFLDDPGIEATPGTIHPLRRLRWG
ncbi:MAG: hypothetical protein ACLF0P_11995 [Thermoanaerobaculia bacterium]